MKARGQDNGNATLNEAKVIAIRAALADGAISAALAERYGVSVSAVKRIKQGSSWAHLGGAVVLSPEARTRMERAASERRTSGVRRRASQRQLCREGHSLTGENVVIGRRRGTEYRVCRRCLLSRRNARLRANPSARLQKTLARAIWGVLNGETAGSAFSRLGYSADELRVHLEKLFEPGMGWGNYGSWHVDHVTAKSKFDHADPVQFAQCWALSNLQPLWALDNMRKGAK